MLRDIQPIIRTCSPSVEKLRGARGMDEVMAIQTNYMKEVFENATQHERTAPSPRMSSPISKRRLPPSIVASSPRRCEWGKSRPSTVLLCSKFRGDFPPVVLFASERKRFPGG